MKQRFLDWLANTLARRATPYFHLYGYMMRWWLVPYSRVVLRTLPEDSFGPEIVTADGTGPVAFWHRPVAWCFQRLGLAIRLHDILRSDDGRDPHDHPWPYVTVILQGGYWEERYSATGQLVSRKWHGPGSVLFRNAHHLHRLVLPARSVCRTLFITGPYKQGRRMSNIETWLIYFFAPMLILIAFLLAAILGTLTGRSKYPGSGA